MCRGRGGKPFSAIRSALISLKEKRMAENVMVAVITGQHGYEVPNFHRLFRLPRHRC